MREMVLLSIAVAWSGIQFGTLWIMQTSILALLNSRPADSYAETCQGIDMHFFHPIALWGGVAMMLNGLFLTTQLDETSARVACGVAALGMLGVGIISEGTNRPIWRRIEKWTAATLPDDWLQIRKTWSTAHTLRTISAFIAVVMFTTAMILEFG